MDAHGYTIERNVLYQDNKSTILLAKNGRMSARKNSRHIQNQFFLITDKVAQGDLEIRHMGTKSMWADVNTKPIQVGLYQIFRHQMMGIPIEYDDDVERRRTHPLLLPEVEAEGVSQADSDLIEKVQVIAPTKKVPSYKSIIEKGIIQGKGGKSISPISKASEKRRSVLREPKYGPRYEPQWKAGRTCYPAFCKALLEEPSKKSGGRCWSKIRSPRGSNSIKIVVLIFLVRVSTYYGNTR